MDFLRIQRLCLNSIGFTFKKDESRIWTIYSLFNLISIVVIIMPEWHFVIENISDIPLATDALCTLLTSMLSISKMTTICLKKDKFYRVIKQLDDMWLKSSESDHLILEQGHRIDRRLTLCYLLSTIGVAVLYLLFPIFKVIFDLMTTGVADDWIMPMRSIFLYDISVSPNYELTYLWFVQCTSVAVTASVGVDCLFYGSSFNLSSHFQIIQKKIRNVKFDQITVEQKTRSGKRVATDDFFDVIKYHQNVLHICDEFREMYSAVLFIQFLITSVQLCVIAFQLTLPNQQLMMMVIFVLFLSAICFQLFTYCHAGSQLTAESLAVSDAIYDSNWYEATPSFQKMVGIFLMRSQKPVIMYTGFHVADLETFNAILKTAGSYMAILQSLSE